MIENDHAHMVDSISQSIAQTESQPHQHNHNIIRKRKRRSPKSNWLLENRQKSKNGSVFTAPLYSSRLEKWIVQFSCHHLSPPKQISEYRVNIRRIVDLPHGKIRPLTTHFIIYPPQALMPIWPYLNICEGSRLDV